MNTAEQYKQTFDQSRQVWANHTAEVAAEHIINDALTSGKLKRVDLFGRFPTVEFTDGSLVMFKQGSWVEKGFYAQVQDRRA